MRVSLYMGHLLSSDDCHALDRQGNVCAQKSITDSPAPLCESHVRILHNAFTTALKGAAR